MANLTNNGIRMVGRLVILLVRLRCHVRLFLIRYVILLVVLVVFIRLIVLCMADMTRDTTLDIAINMTSSINITRTRNMGQIFTVTSTLDGYDYTLYYTRARTRACANTRNNQHDHYNPMTTTINIDLAINSDHSITLTTDTECTLNMYILHHINIRMDRTINLKVEVSNGGEMTLLIPLIIL